MPLFSVDYWVEAVPSQAWTAQSLNLLISTGTITGADITMQALSIVDMYSSGKGEFYPLMHLNVPAYNGYVGYTYSSGNYKDEFHLYRSSEIIKMSMSEQASGQDKVQIILDGREIAKKQAWINIIRTLFVSLVLTAGALWFSSDVSEIAL